jgi:hypothetical protein
MSIFPLLRILKIPPKNTLPLQRYWFKVKIRWVCSAAVMDQYSKTPHCYSAKYLLNYTIGFWWTNYLIILPCDPDNGVVRRSMGKWRGEHRRQQSQLCTCQSRCQRPMLLLHRHTCWSWEGTVTVSQENFTMSTVTARRADDDEENKINNTPSVFEKDNLSVACKQSGMTFLLYDDWELEFFQIGG